MAEKLSSWEKAQIEATDRALKTVYFPPKEKTGNRTSGQEKQATKR